MKKNIVLSLLFCIVFVLLLTGCTIGNDSASTTSSPDESLESLEPLSPPVVQPIQFDSLDDAIDFIKNNDLSKYREEEQIK